MAFYVVPYLFVLFGSWLVYNLKLSRNSYFYILLFLLLPATLIALLRGNIGTDTLNYLGYFKDLADEKKHQVFEPGFEFLANILILVSSNERFNIALVSLFTILLLCKSFSSAKSHIVLFAVLLFPIFFYDMTMNGLRYGLSFAFCSLAIATLYKKKNTLFVLIGIAAISIQYSSILILITFLIFKLKKRYLIGLVITTTLALPFIVGYFTNNLDYFYNKQDLYRDLMSPGKWSGVGPLLLFSLIFGSFILYSSKERSNNILILILAFELGSFALARITYAGLRFQMLFLFALLIMVKEEYFLVKKSKEYLFLLSFIGLFGFFLTVKNLYTVTEEDAPFIPYRFFWQESS